MIVVIIAESGEADCTIELDAWPSGISPMGLYEMTEVSPTVYESEEIDGIDGEYRVRMKNGDDEPVYTGYVEFTGATRGHAIAEPKISLNQTGPDVRLVEFYFAVDAEPVAGVAIRVAGRTTYSDAQGLAKVWLTAGEYTVRFLVPTGYEDVDELDLEVEDEDITQAVELVALSPTVIPTAETCAVTVLVINQSGQKLSGIQVNAKLPQGYTLTSSSIALNVQASATTNADGRADLLLLRTKRYELRFLTSVGNMVALPITVPNAPTATLTQIVS